MENMDPKEKILNTAMELFARKGFFNTSIREITKKSDTNIASVNYYFGSKVNLAISLIEKIILPINKVRINQLETYLLENDHISTRGIVKIFIEPVFDVIINNERGILAHEFLNRIIISGSEEIKFFFHSLMMPVLNEFLNALSKCNENLAREELVERLLFSIGSMQHSIIMISGVYFKSSIFKVEFKKEKVIENLIGFVVRGIEG